MRQTLQQKKHSVAQCSRLQRVLDSNIIISGLYQLYPVQGYNSHVCLPPKTFSRQLSAVVVIFFSLLFTKQVLQVHNIRQYNVVTELSSLWHWMVFYLTICETQEVPLLGVTGEDGDGIIYMLTILQAVVTLQTNTAIKSFSLYFTCLPFGFLLISSFFL